ncbi:uncharacterized protein [Paramormyrops kingsleyae]|uniref:uncharacterized protein n=1 Tax=Paramormyrops kingsleyae TaxID=1676925 RepID=UPI003B9774A9
MEDATFVAFCHFIADVFSGISKFSLLLQRNEIILPQAVCGLEKLLVTTEAMVVRPKPNGQLSEFLADMRLQRRQQQDEGEMAIYKFQTITLKGEASKLAGVMDATIKSTVKHLKARFSSLLGESASESDTTKAVKCFKIFNHDSWPENQEDLVDHGADDLAFLLDHFSTVLRRNGVITELAKEVCRLEAVNCQDVQRQDLPQPLGAYVDQRALLFRVQEHPAPCTYYAGPPCLSCSL